MDNDYEPLEVWCVAKVADDRNKQLVSRQQGLKVSIESSKGVCVIWAALIVEETNQAEGNAVAEEGHTE